MRVKVAIIGGGIAGSSVAIRLGNLGIDVTLFEKKESLVSGPPMCHLHAGGNLYREISDAQCARLLEESVEFLRFYPHGVDFRPTVIAIPVDDPGTTAPLIKRLEFLQQHYAMLIRKDPKNSVLGDSQDYFRLYDREALESMRKKKPLRHPKSMDEWMQNAALVMDLDRIKFPLILVQEYGLNMFRLAASTTDTLQKIHNVSLMMQTEVKDITYHEGLFTVVYQHGGVESKEKFDYLINAAGFLSGTIDDMLGIHQQRFVEFKAAYVTRWKHDAKLPEIIFHGERGTPRGMAQFTPYPGGFFQLHGMTKEITLFDDGLVQNKNNSAQPQLHEHFLYLLKDHSRYKLNFLVFLLSQKVY